MINGEKIETNNPGIDKWLALRNLKEGDKIKLTDGSIAYFVKMKRKNFTAKINDQLYNIPETMFVELIEAAQQVVNTGYKKLKVGELFFIKHKGDAVVYRFEELKNGRIVGINPITNGRTRIDVSLYGGKLSEL